MKINKVLLTSLLSFGLVLTGCGTNNNKSNNPSGGDNHSGDASEPGGNSSSQGSSQGGGNSQGGETQTDRLKTLVELENAIAHHFHFEYRPNASISDNSFEQSEIVRYATDGTYTAWNEGYDRLWVNIDGGSCSYGTLKDGKWRSLSGPTTEPISVAEVAAKNTMMQFVDSIEYTSKERVTFLNRNATKYTLEIDEGDMTQGQFYKLFSETIIDDDTGLALRHYSRQQGNTSRTLPLCFEVSTLNIGDSADAFINTMKQKIGITDWYTDFFTSMGLSSVARPEGKFWGAEIKDGADDDDYVVKYETNFHWYCTKEEGMAKARSMCQAFFGAGLSYDDNGNMKSSYTHSDLYYEDADDGYVTFDAYTSVGHYVDFDFEFSNYSNPKYMNVSLVFYKVS